MKHLDSVRAGLNKKLISLTFEVEKIRNVLDTLATLDNHTPKKVKFTNITGNAEWRKQKRVRHVRYTVKCHRCGNLFKARSTPNGKNPNRVPKFCHKPCTGLMLARELAKKAQERQQLHRDKGTVLIKGDTLSASSSH
jgi:hypothetical protein